MTDRPSLLSLDSPTDAYRALRPRGPGVPRPVDPPSVWSQFSTAAKSSAGLDEIAEARRQKAVDDGYATIIDELNRRGLASDRYSWRLPLPGAQPFYNEDAIWQGVGEARKRDPKAFADIGKDPTAFRAARTAPVDAADADRQRILKQSGWAPWLAGQFYGGFSDPINQAGMLVGAGGARSIAQAALRDAGINLAIEAAQAPSRAIERAGRGVETTPGSVASELALAVGTGALFGGASLLMGILGVKEVAAHAVALNIASLTFQVPLGVAQAATIRVGMAFGARDHGWITRAGRVALAVGAGSMAISAIAMWVAPRLFVSAYLDISRMNI